MLFQFLYYSFYKFQEMKKQKKEFEHVNKGYEFAMTCVSMSFIAMVIILLILMIQARM